MKYNFHIPFESICYFLPHLIHCLDLSPQKPQRMASQREDGIVDQWIMEVWPNIKAHARRWQAIIYLQDESPVQLTAVMGMTWAPGGKTPIIRVTGNSGSIMVTSATSPGGRMVFRFEKEKIKAKQHIEFLSQGTKTPSKQKDYHYRGPGKATHSKSS